MRPTKLGSAPAACSGVGTSVSSTPGASASSSCARATVSGRANSALIDSEWPVNTGTRTQVPRHQQVGDAEDLAALVAQLLLLVGLERPVVDDADPASGSTLKAIGCANLTGVGNVTAEPSWVSSAAAVDDLRDLLVEFVDAGEAAARHAW